jgi:hypothetical protein
MALLTDLTAKARDFPSEGHNRGGVYPRPSPATAGLRDTAKGLVRELSQLTCADAAVSLIPTEQP